MAGTLELYPPTYTNKHHNSGDPPQQYHNTTVTIQSNSLSLMLFTRARAFVRAKATSNGDCILITLIPLLQWIGAVYSIQENQPSCAGELGTNTLNTELGLLRAVEKVSHPMAVTSARLPLMFSSISLLARVFVFVMMLDISSLLIVALVLLPKHSWI